MADAITIRLITYEEIKTQYPFWNKWKIMEDLYKKGYYPQVLHIDVVVDTSTANVLTESTKPTDELIDFAAAKQLYLRSDAAGDVSKKIDVIGQKADGSFGQFTLTTDDTDGTTPVDCGTWLVLFTAIKNDAFAGNALLDDDGASGTVYFTCALGASATLGIAYIPDGFKGCLLDGYSVLTAIMDAQAKGNLVQINDSYDDLLTLGNFKGQIQPYGHFIEEQTRIAIKTAFKTAVTTMNIHSYIVLWE